jgi:hypothetical protein
MKKTRLVEYIYFIEALILLHVSKLFIIFMPFKRIAGKIGKLHVESSKFPINSAKINDVEHAVRRASRFCLHESKCYDQALAGKFMLRRRSLPATLYFGLAKDIQHGLSAHAWVRCGNRIVTGKAGQENFTVIAAFGDPS